MIHITDQPKERLYEYRGKQFKCDERTIAALNYALALNGSEERYVLVTKTKKTNGNDE